MGTSTASSVAAPAMTHTEREVITMMSKEVKLEICRLRNEGHGPSYIAQRLGLPVSTIKSYIYTHITQRESHCQFCGRIIRIPKHPKPGNILCSHCRKRHGWR